MISIQGTPILFTACVLLVIIAGVGVLTWGRRAPQYSRWIIAGVLLILFGVCAFSWSQLIHEGLQAQTWLRGWMMPKDELGSITVGVFQEPIGITMALLSALVSLLALFNRSLLSRESRSERFYSALAIGCAGVALCWTSMTPWLGFVGLAITIFGGFIALGAHWSTDQEAAAASRFGWEKSWGLILAWLGTCILAGSRAALVWETNQIWENSGNLTDAVGAVFLVLGIFIQLQSFPFMGWLLLPSQNPPLFRVLLNQVFPAWAGFAILIRLEPQLRAIGVFPGFGWFALGSVFLTVVSGLLEAGGRRVLGLWIASGFALTLAVLAFAGPWSAVALLISSGLGGAAVAGAISCLKLPAPAAENEELPPRNPNKATWAKVGAFVGASCATGVIGFIAAGGLARWMGLGSDQPAWIAAFLISLFFVCLVGWRLIWMASRIHSEGDPSWYSVLLPLLLSVLGMGWIWSGSLTGSALAGNPDHLAPSLLDLVFGQSGNGAAEPGASGVWLNTVVQLIAFVVAYSMSGREKDLWAGARGTLPRFSEFVVSGYRLDVAGSKVLAGLRWLACAFERWLDRTFDVWIWKKGTEGLEWCAVKFAAADDKLSEGMHAGVERAVNVPAKLLQLVQSGDVQWYLLLALGSGAAMLIHFLKS